MFEWAHLKYTTSDSLPDVVHISPSSGINATVLVLNSTYQILRERSLRPMIKLNIRWSQRQVPDPIPRSKRETPSRDYAGHTHEAQKILHTWVSILFNFGLK